MFTFIGLYPDPIILSSKSPLACDISGPAPETAGEIKPMITRVPLDKGKCFLPGGGKGDSFC